MVEGLEFEKIQIEKAKLQVFKEILLELHTIREEMNGLKTAYETVNRSELGDD